MPVGIPTKQPASVKRRDRRRTPEPGTREKSKCWTIVGVMARQHHLMKLAGVKVGRHIERAIRKCLDRTNTLGQVQVSVVESDGEMQVRVWLDVEFRNLWEEKYLDTEGVGNQFTLSPADVAMRKLDKLWTQNRDRKLFQLL